MFASVFRHYIFIVVNWQWWYSRNGYLMQTIDQVHSSVIYYHRCQGLIIEMFENHTFMVFTFLHNCSMFEDTSISNLIRTFTCHSKSLLQIHRKIWLLDCKLGIKMLKRSHSGRPEIAKIQNLLNLQCLPDPQLWCNSTSSYC